MAGHPTRALLAVAALLGLAAGARPAAPQAPAPPQRQPTFPAEVELVTVDVVVTDKQGRPIRGLTAADFTVQEDGQRQGISSFEAVEVPQAKAPGQGPGRAGRATSRLDQRQGPVRHRADVRDLLRQPQPDAGRGSPREGGRGAVPREGRARGRPRDAGGERGRRLVEHPGGGGAARARVPAEAAGGTPACPTSRRSGSRPGRRCGSTSTATRRWPFGCCSASRSTTRFPPTAAAARGSASSSTTRTSRSGPPRCTRTALIRNRATLELLNRIMLSLDGSRGRKAVLLVSGGFIYDTTLPGIQARPGLRASLQRRHLLPRRPRPRGHAGRADGAVRNGARRSRDLASGGFGGEYIGSTMLTGELASEGAQSLASESGGFTIKNTNDLASGINRIADESQAYYLLGYRPTNTLRDGRFRKIEVDVAPQRAERPRPQGLLRRARGRGRERGGGEGQGLPARPRLALPERCDPAADERLRLPRGRGRKGERARGLRGRRVAASASKRGTGACWTICSTCWWWRSARRASTSATTRTSSCGSPPPRARAWPGAATSSRDRSSSPPAAIRPRSSCATATARASAAWLTTSTCRSSTSCGPRRRSSPTRSSPDRTVRGRCCG